MSEIYLLSTRGFSILCVLVVKFTQVLFEVKPTTCVGFDLWSRN